MNRNGASNSGTKRDGDGPLEELSLSPSPSLPPSLSPSFPVSFPPHALMKSKVLYILDTLVYKFIYKMY